MYRMENRQIDSKHKSTIKEGKKGIFRILQPSSPRDDLCSLVELPEKAGQSPPAGRKEPKKSLSKDKSKKTRPLIPATPSVKIMSSSEDEINNDNSHHSAKDGRSSTHNDKPQPLVRMDDNVHCILLTWVGRKVSVRNVKKSLKELVTVVEEYMPPRGTYYSCCESFDTYITGGLYPLLHITEDVETIKNILSNHNFLPKDVIGEHNMIEQAVYAKVASVTPPGGKTGDGRIIAVAGFRCIEDTSPPDVLLREWKSWTGSRGFIVDILNAGLNCIKVTFYVKKEPRDDPSSFLYLVTTEVAIREPNDEGLFVDVLQRFRVERLLGYRTAYRVYNVT